MDSETEIYVGKIADAREYLIDIAEELEKLREENDALKQQLAEFNRDRCQNGTCDRNIWEETAKLINQEYCRRLTPDIWVIGGTNFDKYLTEEDTAQLGATSNDPEKMLALWMRMATRKFLADRKEKPKTEEK